MLFIDDLTANVEGARAAGLQGFRFDTTDPAASVVDANSRAHACPNLLILDGSVFTTAAALNPTSTIQALALRAATALIRDRASIGVAA